MVELDSETWPDDILQVLIGYQVRQIAYVPDAGHTHLIRLCHGQDTMISVLLTTEEEGVALLAGPRPSQVGAF